MISVRKLISAQVTGCRALRRVLAVTQARISRRASCLGFAEGGGRKEAGRAPAIPGQARRSTLRDHAARIMANHGDARRKHRADIRSQEHGSPGVIRCTRGSAGIASQTGHVSKHQSCPNSHLSGPCLPRASHASRRTRMFALAGWHVRDARGRKCGLPPLRESHARRD
jgi:hypothetical protein